MVRNNQTARPSGKGGDCSERRSPLQRALRVTLGIATSICLVAGIAVPAALAAPNGNWSAPQEEKAVDANVIALGSHKSATSFAELLGLNGTVVTTSQINPTTLDEAQTCDRLGIYGSDANQNPNPYLYNEFYNFYAKANGSAVSTNTIVHDTTSSAYNEATFNAFYEEGYGTTSDLALRPDIVLGIGGAPGGMVEQRYMNHDTTDSLNYQTWGTGLSSPSQTYQYVLEIRAWTNDASQVGVLNSDGNAYQLSDYYKPGDETYDPIGIEYSATWLAGSDSRVVEGYPSRVVDTIAVAKAAERVMQQNGDKTTRYGDPLEIALDYERYVKAIKWYMMSKIADGSLAKKKVAVVADVISDEGALKDGKFRLVKLDPDQEIMNLGTMAAAWAVEDTVDDMAAEVNAAASAGLLRISDAVNAAKLMEADVVVCLPSYAMSLDSSTAKVEAVLEAAGYSADDAAWPLILDNTVPNGSYETNSDFNKSVEAALLIGLYQGNIYRDQLDPLDAIVYYASKFLHLKDEAVGPFLKAELANTTLVASDLEGRAFDAADIQQAIARVDAALDAGVAYYYANKASIDAARPNIASTADFDFAQGYGVGEVKITAPQGATITVTNDAGVVLAPTASGVYEVGSEPLTATISLAGYRDYVATIKNDTGSLAVALSDMVKTRTFTVSVPEGATYVVRDSSNDRVFPRGGIFTVAADEVAKLIVELEDYDRYTVDVPIGATQVNVALADMKRVSTATTVVVPSGATFTIVDAGGNAVAENHDGTYDLVGDDKYTLTVHLEGFKAYTREVTGGAATRITVYRKDLTELVDLLGCTIELVPTTFAYTGAECKPAVTVKNGDEALVEGTDFAVSYSDNVDVGTATVAIEALPTSENCMGSTLKKFSIVKASQDETAIVKTTSKTVKAKALKKKAQTVSGAIKVSNAFGTVKYTKAGVNKNAGKFKVNANTGKITLLKGLRKGAYKVKVKVALAGDENHDAFAKTVTVAITVK